MVVLPNPVPPHTSAYDRGGFDQLPQGSLMQPYESARAVQRKGRHRVRRAEYQRGRINKTPIDGVRAIHGKPRPK